MITLGYLTMSWSKDQTMGFIHEYRSLECLWKTKSKDYHNRDKKDSAYRVLLELVRRFDTTFHTKDNVIRKINNMRSAFRKEYKKVLRSRASGGDLYVPKLWYYNELHFLWDQDDNEAITEGVSTHTTVDEDEEESPGDPFQDSDPPYVQQQLMSANNNNEPASPLSRSSADMSPRHARNHAMHGHYARNQSQQLSPCDQVLVTLARRLTDANDEDHLDVFGKYVAHKLRRMDNEQRIYAQKLINNTLFEGELGGLTRFWSVVPDTNPTWSQPPHS